MTTSTRVCTYPSTFFPCYSGCLHWKVSWNIQLGNMSSYYIKKKKKKIGSYFPENVYRVSTLEAVLMDPSWCHVRSHRDSWQDPIQLCCCFTPSSFVFYALLSVKMSPSAVSDPIFMPFNQRLLLLSIAARERLSHQRRGINRDSSIYLNQSCSY